MPCAQLAIFTLNFNSILFVCLKKVHNSLMAKFEQFNKQFKQSNILLIYIVCVCAYICVYVYLYIMVVPKGIKS